MLDAVDGACRGARERLKSLFEQSWFPSLDAAVAYALVRERKPQRIIEVGSGHSTRILARARVRRRRDRRHRSGAARRHRRPARRARRAVDPAGRAGRACSTGSGRRRAVHRFQPHPDAGQRRRHPAQSRPAAPAGRRAGAHPRHLPARSTIRAIWGWRDLQRAAGRGCRCWRPAPIGRCSPASGRRGGWPIGWRASVVARLPQPADAMPTSLWLEKV